MSRQHSPNLCGIIFHTISLKNPCPILKHCPQVSLPCNKPMSAENLARKWTRKCGTTTLLGSITRVVFLFLDFLDVVLRVVFELLDEFFEDQPRTPCYHNDGAKNGESKQMETTSSESLYERENLSSKMGFLGFVRKWKMHRKKKHDGDGDGDGSGINRSLVLNRWSDCGCKSCVSWIKNQQLHVVVTPLPQVRGEDREAAENVIFLHGFLSSSSFWTETVFDNLSESSNGDYKLFAVDLLGWGRSPKPNDSMYTLDEHIDMIEKSVISPFQLNSFHLVAHSMGCIVALALAAKYPNLVRSVTLVAPPYFPSAKYDPLMVLNKLAGKTLWPPLAFGKSIMSWYEHIGRCFCFLFCRNHRTWETILKLFTLRRELNFMEVDLTRHTHHSAWHSMHNVICGGVTLMDENLEILKKSRRVKVCIIHGDQDMEVPLKCSKNMKTKFPELVELDIVRNADHSSVIIHGAKDFAKSLRHIWASSQNCII